MSIEYVDTYRGWQEADKIVVVGFGFGADDEHINGIIRNLIDIDNKPIQIVTVKSDKTKDELLKDYAIKLKTLKCNNISVIQVDRARQNKCTPEHFRDKQPKYFRLRYLLLPVTFSCHSKAAQKV